MALASLLAVVISAQLPKTRNRHTARPTNKQSPM